MKKPKPRKPGKKRRPEPPTPPQRKFADKPRRRMSTLTGGQLAVAMAAALGGRKL